MFWYSVSIGQAEGGTQPTLVSDSTRGQVMQSGSGKGWAKTANPLQGKDLDGFTVGAWVEANAVDTWNGIWSISSGTENTDGFFGLSTNGSLYFNDRPVNNTTYQDMKEFGGTITTGGWVYITVVMDGQKISMYKDGLLAKELTPSTLGTNAGQGTSYMLGFVSNWQYLYFGTASPHYWNSGDFYLDDLKVYDKALTGAEVLGEYLADAVTAQAFVDADLAALTLPDTAIESLTLPTAGESGYTTIAWRSNNETVIANDGTVARPAQETEVQLTATISLGEIQKEQIFTVKVPASNDSSDLKYYAQQLTLCAGYIASDLSLPTSIGTADISWGYSNGDVLTVVGNTAKVTRPAANTSVTLTATLTLGEASTSKEFSLVVLAQGASVVTYVSNDPALTTDGLKGQKGGMKIAAEGEDGSYTVLHKNQPILYTALGAKAYAAPALFRMADGTFGLVAADGGSNGKILLYTSDDLIDYANERQVTLSGLSSIRKLSCVYDLTESQYLLYAEDQSGEVHTYTSSDLRNFVSTDASDFAFTQVEKVPSDAVWASALDLTQVEVTAPTKTTYTQGEALDTTGMVVIATYGDGSTADVTAEATVSGYDAETIGTQTVTVTYTENGLTKTDTFTVTLQAAVEEPVAVTGVTLNTNTVTLTVGQSTLLIATVAPEDATNRNVRWTSSDSTIAAVDSDGNVKAVAAGEAIITVTTEDGSKAATCTITVTKQPGGGTHVDPVEPSKPVEEQPEASYSDVKPTDWYAEAVEYVSAQGLMTGVGNGKFSPDTSVTRAMVWTVLARMAGENTDGGATWYAKAQAWAMETGVSDGTNPTGSITREQLAAMLYRFEGSPAVSGNLNAYPDANEVSDWAVDALVWATQEGMINGIGGSLSPKTGATRAQLATMLMRFCQR